MLASFKCLFLQQKALNFARSNSGLHFSRHESSHTPVPCRCWQADQVGGGISCNPSLKLESCYVRPSWFVGSTSVNKQDQKQSGCTYRHYFKLGNVPSLPACPLSPHMFVAIKELPSFLSYHTHFPFEVSILHLTSNYKKAYRLHADQKRV